MKKRKNFLVCCFTLMVTIVLVLPGAALALPDLSGSWSVNSTAPAMGCNYSGTANLTQNDSSIEGSINLTLTGDDCPSPINLSLHFAPTGAGMAATIPSRIPDFSGIWSVNSTAPIMGCNYSGTANIIQTDSSLKALVTLTFTGNGCPSEITLPIFFTLSSPS